MKFVFVVLFAFSSLSIMSGCMSAREEQQPKARMEPEIQENMKSGK